MSYRIFWTDEAISTFNDNLEYLSEEWNRQVIQDFLLRTEQVLDQILQNPEVYPIYRHQDVVRKCIVHKRISLYFRVVDSKTIHLLTWWNNYRDPANLEL